ncbi:hypothetical protein QCA50_004999 [Cerrena zonata]|uniref:BTB domain-containing protein n=1 Tax=Cerrena zonata TaxID=2478898 RepID=A0AAW0GQW1_9APHY
MSTERTIAQPPFDNATASDIVLRSRDQIDFYVSREILVTASSFFDTLFSLPAPSSNSTPNSDDSLSPEGLHTILIDEMSDVVDYILRVCYPHPNPPPPTSVLFLERVLTAALKYDISAVITTAREALVRAGTRAPVRMFMFSCQSKLEKEARFAADLLRKKYYPENDQKAPASDVDFVRIAMTEIYNDDDGHLPAIFVAPVRSFVDYRERVLSVSLWLEQCCEMGLCWSCD